MLISPYVHSHSFINLQIQDTVEFLNTLRIGYTNSKMRDALKNMSCVPLPRGAVCSVYACLWDEVLCGRDDKRNKENSCVRMVWVIVGMSGDGGVVVK